MAPDLSGPRPEWPQTSAAQDLHWAQTCIGPLPNSPLSGPPDHPPEALYLAGQSCAAGCVLLGAVVSGARMGPAWGRGDAVCLPAGVFEQYPELDWSHDNSINIYQHKLVG